MTPKGTLLRDIPALSLVHSHRPGYKFLLWMEDAIAKDSPAELLKLFHSPARFNDLPVCNIFHLLTASISMDAGRCVLAILRKEPFLEYCVDAATFATSGGSPDPVMGEYQMLSGLRAALVDLSFQDDKEFRKIFAALVVGEFSDRDVGRSVLLDVMDGVGESFYGEIFDQLDDRFSRDEVVFNKLLSALDAGIVWDYSSYEQRLDRTLDALNFFEARGVRVVSQVDTVSVLRKISCPSWFDTRDELAEKRIDVLNRLERVGLDYGVVDKNGHGLVSAAIEACDGDVLIFCAQRAMPWLCNYTPAQLAKRAVLNKSRTAAAASYLHLLRLNGHRDVYEAEMSALVSAGSSKGGLLRGRERYESDGPLLSAKQVVEQSYPALASASYSLNAAVMREMVGLGVAIDEKAKLDGERGEQSVMECAVLSKRLENIKYAISLGFDINEIGSTGRPVIARTNNADLLQRLRSEEADRSLMEIFGGVSESVTSVRKSGLSML